MKDIEIEVFGRVQGVSFRRMVRNFCINLSLKGYVKNRDDGSVFILAQGEESKLNNLLKWIQSEPGISKITGMSFRFKEISKKYDSFFVIKNKSFILDQTSSLFNLGRSFFKSKIDRVPVHVAIIPDGNRRWAKERGLNVASGHYKSGNYNNILALFKESEKLGIKYLSIWGFSTENWSRENKEVNSIFSLLDDLIDKFLEDNKIYNVRFRHVGRKDRIPKTILSKLTKLEKETKECTGLNVQLCLDYGGRDEIVRAVNDIIKKNIKKVDEKIFAENLDSADIPDPDLIIRTSGEKRTSGFMPFQSAYAELYFTNVYFPEFEPKDLREAVLSFSERDRRFGAGSK